MLKLVFFCLILIDRNHTQFDLHANRGKKFFFNVGNDLRDFQEKKIHNKLASYSKVNRAF